MNYIKTNFNFLELTYKSTLNIKRKIKNVVEISTIQEKLFGKGNFNIPEYVMICDELYELESIRVD